MRTDNDIYKVPKKNEWQYAGMNRCLEMINENKLDNEKREIKSIDTIANGTWEMISSKINSEGIFLSEVDLETDLVRAMSNKIKQVLDEDDNNKAIEYLQKKKAVRMMDLLPRIKTTLPELKHSKLAMPLLKLVQMRKAYVN